MQQRDLDTWHMQRALELAALGEGAVEPNPMVGCVIARGAEIVGEGWHRRFGGPHAEIEALRIAGPRAAGATAYVTLEPCCHHGKTPPCTEALAAARIGRVVAAMRDPFPRVDGGGFAALAATGIVLESGVLEGEARQLNAPYLKLLATGRPWVIAKWAMTLDGKIATRTGSSRWISGERSREVVHHLRGRVDAILVGRGTAERDDPLLTARPPGVRVATRVVLDTRASLAETSRLVQTARDIPVLVVVGPEAPAAQCRQLASAGVEVLCSPGASSQDRLGSLFDEFGRRGWTNVLVEGGAKLLGSLFDARWVDEVHVFIAPKIAGGQEAPSPVGGVGLAEMTSAWRVTAPQIEQLDGDVYLRGRVANHAGCRNGSGPNPQEA